MSPVLIALLVLLGVGVVVVAGFLVIGYALEQPMQRHRRCKFERCLKTWTHNLNEQRVNYFVDYGTLLGHVRDGGVILGDEDIDISVHVQEPADADRLLTAVRAVHASGDYDVEVLPHVLHWVWRKDRNICGDFYVYRADPKDPTYVVNMDNKSQHSRTRLFPTREETFGRRQKDQFVVRVPAEPEGAVQDRYGGGWRTPTPFSKSKADGFSPSASETFVWRPAVTWRDMLGYKKKKTDSCYGQFAEATYAYDMASGWAVVKAT